MINESDAMFVVSLFSLTKFEENMKVFGNLNGVFVEEYKKKRYNVTIEHLRNTVMCLWRTTWRRMRIRI